MLLILALVSCDIGTTRDNSVPGNGLAEKLNWLRTNAQSGDRYTIEIGADESITPNRILEYSGRSNITITLRGTGGNRTINLSDNGNMFIVRAGVTLILDNITLRGRSFNTYPLIYVRTNAALQMNDSAVITGNISSNGSGGGVLVEGAFIMNGGTISGNAAAGDGGGVCVTAGNFTMSGGTISGNNANNIGGGVAMLGKGTFVMSGGTISGNNTNITGGGVAALSGTFTMNGGTISGNIAETDGGGVWVEGTFTMYGGTISGNTAGDNGGGVAASKDGTIDMNNGSITDNKATRGGGVTAPIDTIFTMSGGTIARNTAKTYGGGVYAGGAFTKTGGTITSFDSDRRNGNVVSNNPGFVESNNGHAVYAYSSNNRTIKRKETTAGSGVSLSYNGRTGSFNGEWDE